MFNLTETEKKLIEEGDCHEMLNGHFVQNTTFYSDYEIAARFSLNAIKDTYQRSLDGLGDSIEYMTAMNLVLNHLSWKYYEDGKNEIAEWFSELWIKHTDWVRDNKHFTDDEKRYFNQVID